MAFKRFVIFIALLVVLHSASTKNEKDKKPKYEKMSREKLLDILEELEEEDPTEERFHVAMDVIGALKEKHMNVLDADMEDWENLLEKLKQEAEMLKAAIDQKRKKINAKHSEFDQCSSDLSSLS